MTVAFYLSVVCLMYRPSQTLLYGIKNPKMVNIKEIGNFPWQAPLLRSPCDMPKCYLHKYRI